MATVRPTVVEIEVDGKKVEYVRTYTVPAIGAVISLGPNHGDRYNAKVVSQHWVVDHVTYEPEEFRCILVCERIVPKG